MPVSFLKRAARLSRIVDSYVSGNRIAKKMRAKPEIQISSYIGHRQPLACAGKPPITGPENYSVSMSSSRQHCPYAPIIGLTFTGKKRNLWKKVKSTHPAVAPNAQTPMA